VNGVGLAKKGMYGMIFTFFLFIAMAIAEGIGMNPFDTAFLSAGGFILLIAMGFFEVNLVTL